jgi:putative ATPase
VASCTKAAFVKLNAVSAGVADAKKVIEEAKNRLALYGQRTYLLLDECHRWSKAQSDCVLGAMEDGSILLIGSTTENPFVSMTRALVSRCRIFQFKSLDSKTLCLALDKALCDPRGLRNVRLLPEARAFLAWAAAGDLRSAFNALELAALTTPRDTDGFVAVTKEIAEQSIQKRAMSVDDSLYYDMLSAFCKSLRGSDPDAALYWGIRLIESGCDPMLVFRRLIAHSAEDVGLADTGALVVASAALTAFERVGYPEGLLPLSEAIIKVCTSEKSNAVVCAKDAAVEAARRTGDAPVPLHLRDTSYPLLEKPAKPYLYPHDYGGFVEQQYLPDVLKDARFYNPGQNPQESKVLAFVQRANPKKYN